MKYFIKDNISETVDHPEILEKTFDATLAVLKGKLYLKVTVDVEAEWPYDDKSDISNETFYIDYQRLQQKMALEGVKP